MNVCNVAIGGNIALPCRAPLLSQVVVVKPHDTGSVTWRGSYGGVQDVPASFS
jgi:hypothetical protein